MGGTSAKHIILGYSGHAYVVTEAALDAGLRILGYADYRQADRNPYNLSYMGYEGNENFDGWNHSYRFIIGIGDNRLREKVTRKIMSQGEILGSVISPKALISTTAEIGKGTFVSKGAMVNALVKTGISCIINTGSIIEHECEIGACVHIAPGAVLAGNVKVGERSFIGANAVIKEGVEIGNNVLIGAGTVVLNNVQDNSKVVGNPGRVI